MKTAAAISLSWLSGGMLMNKWVFGLVGFVPVAALAQAVPTRGLTNFAEPHRAEPFRETVFGVPVDDPYRWMERADRRAELERWINASSRHTMAELAALPGRERFYQDMEALSRAGDRVSSVEEAGGKLFYELLPPDRQTPVLMVRDGGGDRLLLDPMAGRGAAAPRAISSYSVSPDGRLAAIHIAEGGGEIGAIRVYDVATGRPTDEVGPVWDEFRARWLDDRTFTYTRLAAATSVGDEFRNMVVHLHRIGTPAARDVAVLGGTGANNGFPIDPTTFPDTSADPNSSWTLGMAAGGGTDQPYAVARAADLRAGKPAWVQFADPSDRVNGADILGDTLYYLTSKTDEKGELRAIDLGSGKPSLAASRQVMKSDGRVLSSIAATTSGLYVVTVLPSAANELWFVPRSGGAPTRLPLPVSQALSDLVVTPDRTSITFSMGGFTSLDVYYRATAGKALPVGLVNATPPSAKRRTVIEETATSADGTRVPLTIVTSGARKGPGPTVIEAYGSYGTTGTPFYAPGWDVWNQRGGTYAYCHTRGGGELGEAWHRAGREANKIDAQADLIACGERLVRLGYATPRTLGAYGVSAGGLLVPPVALRRPDLFAAAVLRVGAVNPIRLAAMSSGPVQYSEMGDPNTKAGFEALAAQDSTLLLAKASGGPDFLFTVGLNDKRVEPWMSAKLVAMMHAKWGDRHLALIRSEGLAGHGAGSTRDQDLEERADIYAFFLNRLNAPIFTR